jgi:uncharacterized protein
MLLDLSRIRKAEDHFERTFSAPVFSEDRETYRVVAPVRLAFAIYKDKEKFRLVGNVDTELELTCSRCLEPFRLPLHAAFDQRYLPFTHGSHESETEVEDDDLETSFYRDDQIDLDQLLREQFYLALPMKPLCQEECRGLCPQCGTNLNLATCACAPAWDDPRLEPLKNLKQSH